MNETARINAQYAAANALLALEESDPLAAAKAARQISLAWNDGAGVGTWLWGNLGSHTSAEVVGLAGELTALNGTHDKAIEGSRT